MTDPHPAPVLKRIYLSREAMVIAIALSGAVCAGMAVALLPRALGSPTPGSVVGVSVASVGAFIALACLVRWPWLSVTAYWLLYSVASELRLEWQVRIGSVPITAPDIAIGAMGLAALLALRHGGIRYRLPAAFCAAGALLAVELVIAVPVGLLNGHSTYAVAIDARTFAYLYVGLAAGYLLLNLRMERALIFLMVASLVGFAIEQYQVSNQALAHAQGGAGDLAAYRDIGVSYFAGKYGVLFFLCVACMAPRSRIRLVAQAAFFFGVGVTAVTFIRTAWIALAAGAISALPFLPRRRLTAATGILATAVAIVALGITAVPDTAAAATAAAIRARAIDALQPTSATLDTGLIRNEETAEALSALHSPLDWTLGAGLGVTVPQHPDYPYFHNAAAGLLAKLGVTGLISFLLLVCALPLWSAIQALRTKADTSWVRRALLISLSANTVANLVAGVISGNITSWELTPMVGLTAAWIQQLAAQGPPIES